MINWKVRIRNKDFWLAIIPAMLLFAQSVAALFGYTLDLTETQAKLLTVVKSVFGVFAIIGIVNDPTTAGLSDSYLAMTYKAPKVEQDIQDYE